MKPSAGWKVHAEYPSALELELGRAKEGKVRWDRVQFENLLERYTFAAHEARGIVRQIKCFRVPNGLICAVTFAFDQWDVYHIGAMQ